MKIYVFLQDASKSDFYSPKLQEKRNLSLLAKITMLETGGGGGTGGGGKSGCKKCGMDHAGGYKKCPFKALTDGEAKKQVTQLAKALSNMTSKEASRLLRDTQEE